MPHKSKKSLWQHYPRRWDILFYLLAVLTLLVTAQCLPVLAIKKFVFWKSSYSLWSGTIGLFASRHFGLGAILLTFSIIFPFAKLVILTALWCGHFTQEQRLKVLKWLEFLGRWSMMDVFVVAIIVVIAKSGGPLQASAKIGIYFFATAIIFSLLLTMYIKKLAKRLGT